MNLVMEKSDDKVEIDKNEKLNSEKNADNDEKSFGKKCGKVTESLKKRLHDFWYGWVVVD
jgi:hypothetical protein